MKFLGNLLGKVNPVEVIKVLKGSDERASHTRSENRDFGLLIVLPTAAFLVCEGAMPLSKADSGNTVVTSSTFPSRCFFRDPFDFFLPFEFFS